MRVNIHMQIVKLFFFYEQIGDLVSIGHVNFLCNLVIYFRNFAYLLILVWIHKDACKYI